MISLPSSIRVFLAIEPVDMRLSFDRLAAHVREVILQDPLSGFLFVFKSRTGDRTKILFWDRSGFVLYYKRIEKGVFHFPDSDAKCVEIEATDLALILEGIDLSQAKRRERFIPKDRRAAP